MFQGVVTEKYLNTKDTDGNMKRLHSIFTDDLTVCYFTGKPNPHVHHCFFGSARKHAEEDGFIIPLAPELHNMSDQGVHFNREFDLVLKRQCQEYYEENIGTREQWISRYGKSFL